MTVKIRAKTVMKLTTGLYNLDYTYPANTSMDKLAKDVLHALVQNKGVVATNEFINTFLKEYEPDYPGIYSTKPIKE